MPGWLRRAAAWASRSTRPAGLAALLDRLDRDRALEAAVPGLVDDAEAAAADAALDQEAVEYEGADHSTFDFAAGARLLRDSAAATYARERSYSPATNQLGEPFLEDSASPAAAPAQRRRAVAPNASRSCCGGRSPSAAA